MSSTETEWRVLLEKTHRPEPGAPPPRVGDVIALSHGQAPIITRVRQVLPPENGQAGTLIVEAPWID